MDEPSVPSPQYSSAEELSRPSSRPLRIALPGGSGQVGRMLARFFQERGHLITVLTRGPYTASWQTVHWDGVHPGPWTETLEGADVCINLTGCSINCRHTLANRREIYQSRIGSTRLLHEVIAGLANPPKLWMNASAATIYQRMVDEDGIDLPLDEATGPLGGPDLPVPSDFFTAAGPRTKTGAEPWAKRSGFIKRVVRDWEAAFFATETPRTRKVALRSAATFSPVPGNVFAVLINLVRLSLGGTQGSGRQFVTWIHQADYARAVEFLMQREDLEGPFNIAAPQPLPNRAFMAALREALNMPNGLPAPALAIYFGSLLMRTEAELVLDSCRAVPRRLLDAGFEFLFSEWPEAAEDLAQQWRHRND